MGISLATPAEAFAAIALSAVACDGELAALEARSLRQQLEFRQPYCTYSDVAMGALLDRLLAQLREVGWQALIRSAAPLLNPQQSETALAVAASLVQADHVESSSELKFLDELRSALAIDAERGAVIVDVVALLHRDSLAS